MTKSIAERADTSAPAWATAWRDAADYDDGDDSWPIRPIGPATECGDHLVQIEDAGEGPQIYSPWLVGEDDGGGHVSNPGDVRDLARALLEAADLLEGIRSA